MAFPEGAVQPHDPKKHNAGARMGIILGGGALAVFLLVRGMSGSSSSSGVSSSQEQSDIASAVAAQQQQDAASYGYGAGSYGSGGGGFDTSGTAGTSSTPTIPNPPIAIPPGGGVYDPSTGQVVLQPGSAPPPEIISSGNGQASNGASSPVASPGPNYAQLDAPFLAPGASAPNYALTRPSGNPNALWSGPKSPGSGWRGVGGGWWVKKK